MIRAGSCTSDVVACLENNKLDKSFIIKSILAQFLVINKCSVTQDECYCYSLFLSQLILRKILWCIECQKVL